MAKTEAQQIIGTDDVMPGAFAAVVLSQAMQRCEESARQHGLGYDEIFEPTAADCDYCVAHCIVALGEMPTREDWDSLGYRYVGSAHYEG